MSFPGWGYAIEIAVPRGWLTGGYAGVRPGFRLACGKEVGRVQDRQVPLDVFAGRMAELARIAEVVTRVEGGQPGLAAIEGDPGIGKTSLATSRVRRNASTNDVRG